MNTKLITIAIVDEFDENLFVLNSKDNRMFFENRNRGMNTCYYRVLSSVNVTEDKFQECLEKIKETMHSDFMATRRICVDYDDKYRNVVDMTQVYAKYGIEEA